MKEDDVLGVEASSATSNDSQMDFHGAFNGKPDYVRRLFAAGNSSTALTLTLDDEERVGMKIIARAIEEPSPRCC